MSEILKKSADTLLDNPVSISVDVIPKNWLHGLLMKWKILPSVKKFAIKGATLGTMIRISKIVLDIDLKPAAGKEWSFNLVKTGGDKMIEIIAYAIHNREGRPSDKLIQFIRGSFTAKDVYLTVNIILDSLNLTDFTDSIASVRTIEILSPASLKTEEIIASGEQSTELSSISDTKETSFSGV